MIVSCPFGPQSAAPCRRNQVGEPLSFVGQPSVSQQLDGQRRPRLGIRGWPASEAGGREWTQTPSPHLSSDLFGSNSHWPQLWRSAGGNGASDLDFREKSERHSRTMESLRSSGFRVWFVLVLSIAVLVLVLDSFLRYPAGSLEQSSYHQYDSFQVRFTNLVRIIFNRIADLQDIVN
jgi:hypothetical protein